MPTLPQRRFLKGLNAASPSYDQPAGSVPRVSNLLLTKRGGFRLTNGTNTISLLGDDVVPVEDQIMLDFILYQPLNALSKYVGVIKDPSTRIRVPTTLVAGAAIGGGGHIPAGNYDWAVSAIDGLGHETPISNVVNAAVVLNDAMPLTWDWLPEASGYNIYRKVHGSADPLKLVATAYPFPIAGATTVTVNEVAADYIAPPQSPVPADTGTGISRLVHIARPMYGFPTDTIQLLPADNLAPADGGGDGGGGGSGGGGTGITPGVGGGSATPAGGAPGNISMLPQMLQFNDKLIVCLGNGHPVLVYDGTTVAVLTNTFTASYPAWTTNYPYMRGDLIGSGVNLYQATQGGTSGAAPPAFPAGRDQTVVDGKVIWQNIGPITNSPAPRAAAHGIVYAGALWVANTSVSNTADSLDGPNCLAMSSINNPNSWNPINRAFIGKDDGTQITGLATFTIAESGIVPTGSLVVFKDFSTYQILGVFGSASFSIQQAQTDLGCIAPRSIQFLPGFGIARLSHLGVAVFDGVRDRLIGEEIRPYLFGGEPDISPLDLNYAYFSKGAQVASPPMYVLAIPLPGSFGGLTRLLLYDLVLKAWTVVDLPFPIGSIKQIRIGYGGSLPITVMGSFNDGSLRQIFGPSTSWSSWPDKVTNTPIDWRVRTPEVFGKSAADRLSCRALYIRGSGTASSIRATLTYDTTPLPELPAKILNLANGSFEALLQVHLLGSSVHADITGTGPFVGFELHSFDWDAEPQPTAPLRLV